MESVKDLFGKIPNLCKQPYYPIHRYISDDVCNSLSPRPPLALSKYDLIVLLGDGIAKALTLRELKMLILRELEANDGN